MEKINPKPNQKRSSRGLESSADLSGLRNSKDKKILLELKSVNFRMGLRSKEEDPKTTISLKSPIWISFPRTFSECVPFPNGR